MNSTPKFYRKRTVTVSLPIDAAITRTRGHLIMQGRPGTYSYALQALLESLLSTNPIHSDLPHIAAIAYQQQLETHRAAAH